MQHRYDFRQATSPQEASLPQPPVRWVVVIDSAASEGRVARLYLDTRVAVAEFAAAAAEVATLVADLHPTGNAAAPEWDQALWGHAPRTRADARVYRLEV